MTTSEPKSSRPNPLAEAPSMPTAKGQRPWLAGVYRLESARTLLKAISGKALLDSTAEKRTGASRSATVTVPRDSK